MRTGGTAAGYGRVFTGRCETGEYGSYEKPRKDRAVEGMFPWMEGICSAESGNGRSALMRLAGS